MVIDRVRTRTRLLVALVGGVAAACDPNMSALDPPTGHNRALVTIVGPPLVPGLILWDAGTSQEKWRAGGLAAQMFTVPDAATVGAHVVQRYQAGVRGAQATFIVDERRTFPKPRVDRVSLLAAEFRAGNTVSTLLYVQGADADVGAVVEILDTSSGTPTWKPIPTAAHRGITNRGWDETLHIPSGGLDYPVYHYLTFIAFPGEQPVGSGLQIRIENEDGVASDPTTYTLPLTADDLDSDGDDIPDKLERGLGTSYLRPDILLELDYMDDPAHALVLPWSPAVAQGLHDAFAAAPIINPLGPGGINLVVDASQAIPKWSAVEFKGSEDTGVSEGQCTKANVPAAVPSFLTLKRACFNNGSRGQFYHYCIWASRMIPDKGGYSDGLDESGDGGGYAGDDCMVAADFYLPAWNNPRTKVEVLMHELGHDLGQRHGGMDNLPFKPTYSSVMNASWLGRSNWGAISRKARPICTPLFYQLAGAVEAGGAVPTGADPDLVHGYSEGMGRTIEENDLDEREQTVGQPFGVCNLAIDWDCKPVPTEELWSCDDDATEFDLVRDLTGEGDSTGQLSDYPNWARLLFNGPRLNGDLVLVNAPH